VEIVQLMLFKYRAELSTEWKIEALVKRGSNGRRTGPSLFYKSPDRHIT
jgi:hypothetical protein